jgi:hypothetical protein
VPCPGVLTGSTITSFHWNLDGSPEDTLAWQTYVEAGSLVRWIVESRGWEAFRQFHQTRSALAALGAPITEVEREWLQHLAHQEQTPKSCRDVLAQNVPRFRAWCRHAEPSGRATPPSLAPLPSDVRIVPPDAAVPQQLAAFSGKWAGVVYPRIISTDLDGLWLLATFDPDVKITVVVRVGRLLRDSAGSQDSQGFLTV